MNSRACKRLSHILEKAKRNSWSKVIYAKQFYGKFVSSEHSKYMFKGKNYLLPFNYGNKKNYMNFVM